MKKLALFLVIVLGALCFYCPNTSSVKADAFEVDTYQAEPLYPNSSYTEIWIDNIMKGTVIKNLKISNTKVCVFDYEDGDNGTPVSYDEDYEDAWINLNKKATGTTYVSGEIWWDNKLVKKFSVKLVVYKYINPFKTFKINKKNYAKKFNKSKYPSKKLKKGKKYKFAYKIKKGFKLSYCDFYNGKKYKALKKKSTIKLTKKYKYPYISISVYNKKYKTYEYYTFDLY